MFDFYRSEDTALEAMLPKCPLLDMDIKDLTKTDAPACAVSMPEEGFGFLHEAAVIEHRGTLYASWYNCPEHELHGYTPVRGRRSADGGKTWSPVETVAEDKTNRILYCPPVYGERDGRLYMLINEMVSADHMHALDLYVLDEETDRFRLLWSRPIPFKLNTNVVRLANGKLMLPGRIAEPDGFPNTPAVLISDSGEIDAEWRLVYIQPDGSLPDGSKLIHPELAAMQDGERVYMFCRDDERRVPLVYLSEDCGEHWTGPYATDIPFSNSKIYAGDLSDGSHYVIGNLYPGRSRLALLRTYPGETTFTSGMLLEDGPRAEWPDATRWHYPMACEADDMLYVIYTVSFKEPKRGAVMSALRT